MGLKIALYFYKKEDLMHYPDFFQDIPLIKLQDPLSDILGTFEKGDIDISYLDVVKGSGHSCPTVAGAYLVSYHALKVLYPNKTAQRGNISVSFKEDIQEGVTGVISSVPPDAKQMKLMNLILEAKASPEQRQEFGLVWQDRVKRILIDNFENSEVIKVLEV